jgi:two-component system chemotaxis response regulator CheB
MSSLPGQPGGPPTKKILIVDDSGMMRNLVKQILAVDPEVDVIGEADNGQSCIIKAKELKPDVILLDIEIPVMNGLEAMKRLKLVSRAKVVILSSVAQVGSPAAAEAKALGAVAVIPKPSGAVSLDLKAKRGHEIVRIVRQAAGLPPPDFQRMAEMIRLRQEMGY